MSLTREEIFALIDEKIFTNNSAQIQASDVNQLLKTIYDNAPNTGFEHHIGEHYGGGVIFHLWKDSDGFEHGLIVDTADLSINQAWSSMTDQQIGITAQSLWDGKNNSDAIVAQSGHTYSAAKLCLDSTRNNYNDWYLPAVYELLKLWQNILEVSKTLSNIGGSQLILLNITSSTEYDASNYLNVAFDKYGGSMFFSAKYGTSIVRAIRQF